VLAVHALDSVFERLHQQIRVKRGQFVLPDDAKNDDLIFIARLRKSDAPGAAKHQEFTFKQSLPGPRRSTMETLPSAGSDLFEGEFPGCLAAPGASDFSEGEPMKMRSSFLHRPGEQTAALDANLLMQSFENAVESVHRQHLADSGIVIQESPRPESLA